MALPPEARGAGTQRTRRRKAAKRVVRAAPQAAAFSPRPVPARKLRRVSTPTPFSPRPVPARKLRVVSTPKRVGHELAIQHRSWQASRRTGSARRATPPGAARAMLERERHRQIAQTRPERKAARHPEIRDQLTSKRASAKLKASEPDLLKQVTKELDRQAQRRPISAAGVNLPLSKGAGKAVLSTARNVGGTLGSLVASGVFRTNMDFVAKRGEAAGKDIVDLVTNAIPSTYALGREVAKGHERKALDMILQPYKDLAKASYKALPGTPGSAKDLGKIVGEHPVSTYLLGAGAYGGVGRSAGGVLRHSPSKALREAGSVEAPGRTRTVEGTSLVEPGRYSPNLITKTIQRAVDRNREPQAMSTSQIQRRTDETVAANEDIRRYHREISVRHVNNILKTGRNKPSTATTLLTQNIAHPTHRALEELRDHYVDQGKRLAGAKRRQNEATVRDIEKALKDFDPETQHGAARKYAELSVQMEGELIKRGILSPEAAESARLTPYATRHMGAKFDFEDGVLKNAAGQQLKPADIRAHMAFNGFKEPAYVTQAPNMRGARNFYIAEPETIGSKARTGIATHQGTADFDPAVLVEGHARSQSLIDTFDGYKRFVHEMGFHRGGRLARGSYDRMAALARDLEATGHPVSFRPVRAVPFGARRNFTQAMFDDTQAPQASEFISQELSDALSGRKADNESTYILVPEAAARTYADHLRGTSAGGAVFNVFGSMFRRNVLALSPKWLTGNIVEAALRSMVAGAGPGSYRLGRQALKRLEAQDPAAAEQARVRTIAGGHYSLATRNSVHTPPEKFAGTKLAGVAEGLGKLWRTPGPKHAAQVWHAYTDFVFHTLNGRIESQFQTAMLGRALKRDPLMSDHLLKTSERAIDDAAKGLRGTDAQVRLGREIDKMYGKYGKWSPGMRRAIAGYTPFIAWTLNALRFLFVVLPRDHPVLTSALASANRASEDWRKQHGLVVNPFRVASGEELPGFLQGSIPGGGNSFLRASRFTPFGLAAGEGGMGAAIADSLLPQFEGVRQNLGGKDWKGDSLAGFGKKSADAQNALAAAVSLVEASIPLVGQGSNIAGVKLPNEAPTKAEKGSVGFRARKQLDPFMFTQSRPPKKRTGRAPTGGLYGGGSSGGLYGGGSSGGMYGGGP